MDRIDTFNNVGNFEDVISDFDGATYDGKSYNGDKDNTAFISSAHTPRAINTEIMPAVEAILQNRVRCIDLQNPPEEIARELIDGGVIFRFVHQPQKIDKKVTKKGNFIVCQYQHYLITINGTYAVNVEVKDNQTWKVRDIKCISSTPFWVSAISRDVSKNESFLHISYLQESKVNEIVIPEQEISSPSLASLLSSFDITAMDDGKTRSLNMYLSRSTACKDDIAKKYISTSCVWHNGRHIPYSCDNVALHSKSQGHQQLIDGITSIKGNLDNEIKLANLLSQFTIPRIVMCAAFAGMIIRLIDAQNFTIDLWGESSHGKSVILRAVASFFGDPSKIIKDWDSTQVGLERYFSFLADMPAFLDDGHKYRYKNSDIVHMYGNGSGRSRGRRDIGLRMMDTWRGVLISTSEMSVVSDATHSGSSARAITLPILPGHDILGPKSSKSKDIILEIERLSAFNHGNLARAFVQTIQGQEEWLKKQYEYYLMEFRSQAKTPYATRAAGYFASIMVAAIMLDFPGVNININLAALHQDLQRVASEHDPDLSVYHLEKLWSWLAARANYIEGMGDSEDSGTLRQPIIGEVTNYKGQQEMRILVAEYRRAAKELDIPPEFLTAALNKGWLRSAKANKPKAVQCRIGEMSPRCYVFLCDAVEKALGKVDDDVEDGHDIGDGPFIYEEPPF